MSNTETQLAEGNNNLPAIHKEKFELALKKLEALSKKGDFNIKYEKFETDGGFLGLGNHKVTGSEINENLVKPLQENLNSVQENIKNLFMTSQEIYKTFDALDKEYISGVLASIGMANETSNQALAASMEAKEANRKAELANNDIRRTIEALKQTVNAIKSLKAATSISQFSNISGLTHVSDIDSIWEDVALQKNLTAELNTKLSGLVDTLDKSKNVIKNDLETIRGDVGHLHTQLTATDNDLHQTISEAKNDLGMDITSNLNEIISLRKQISSLKSELSDAEKSFGDELNILKAFQNTLENYRHLADVDSIYEKTEQNEDEITNIGCKLGDFITQTHKMESSLTASLRNAQEESRKESAAIKTQLTDFADDTRKKEQALSSSLQAAQDENQKNLSQIDSKLGDFIMETHEKESELDALLHQVQDKNKKVFAAINVQLNTFVDETRKKEDALSEFLCETQTNLEVFMARTEKRMKIAYTIGGVSTVIALTQLILLLFGIL